MGSFPERVSDEKRAMIVDDFGTGKFSIDALATRHKVSRSFVYKLLDQPHALLREMRTELDSKDEQEITDVELRTINRLLIIMQPFTHRARMRMVQVVIDKLHEEETGEAMGATGPPTDDGAPHRAGDPYL